MEKILISACLLGRQVRYDGKGNLIDDPVLSQWQSDGRLVEICPEMVGGLPTPRPPCEKDQTSGRVFSKNGQDYSYAFEKGAKQTLSLVEQHQIRFALMKARSPSCGSQTIYDGTFQKNLIDGEGITVAALRKQGVQVFDETQIDQLSRALEIE